MKLDLARMRRFAPLAAYIITVGLGWVFLARPAIADGQRIDERIAELRQREAALQATLTQPAPAVTTDPVAAFDRRVATDDPTASVVERLARLASDNRVRGLFIETVEGASSSGRGSAPVAATYQPDPRFGLFDRRVAYTTIRLSFEASYASLGQFLWNLRDLPTIVEVRTLNVQPRMPSAAARTDGSLRASLTFFAYSRPGALSSQPPAGAVTQ
jgi:hypothetical protein